MNGRTAIRTNRLEKGIALLISIFVLLLISVVAIALILSSGTETALAGNYRSSTGVYYAALAGLEEARGRLLSKDPNSFQKIAGFLPSPGTQLNIGEVRYVLNPSPTDVNVLTTYPDTEYDTEFGAGALTVAYAAGTVVTTPSVWNKSPLNALPVSGPLYKWVRINGVSERSLNLDTCTYDTLVDPALVYYGAVPLCNPLSLSLNDQGIGAQVLELTALAVLPNGSQKMVQYLAAPTQITLPPFLAALTLSGSHGGSDPVFQAPANNPLYAVSGDGQDCSGNPATFAAIGFFGNYTGGNYNPARTGLIGGIPTNVSGTNPQLNYTGQNSPAPDVEYLSGYPGNMQTPSQLDAVVNAIVANADVIIPAGPATYPLSTVTGSALTPLGMSASNPLTVVVNGNLNISNWSNDGYGLLVVTGTFTYDPDTNWYGIILVIGQGAVNNVEHGQNKQINGAMLVAKTRDASGNLLPGIGGASVSFDAPMQGKGIRYSSCWIQKAQPTSGYKILSFHEISQ